MGARRAPILRATAFVNPSITLAAGFGALILVGTILLLLPMSTRAGHTGVVVALFTSTSAVCVTGLTVVDTGSYWSAVGQVIILILMQLGGLGFMVGATVLVLVLRRRMSLQQRIILQETGSATHLGSGNEIIVRTVLFTLACELAGAVVLSIRWIPRYGPVQGGWLAIFHAVSAYTNGSFDLFAPNRSLRDFQDDPVVLLPIAALIIIGGLSFITIQDVYQVRHWRGLGVDSKVVLTGTIVLLIGGMLLILLTEHDNPASLAGRPLPVQLLDAFFHASAARTAGFSTWAISASDPRSLFVLLSLMFVGGAPGSMAGGIKITTAGAILAGVWSTLRGRPEATLMKRRLPPGQLEQALAVAVLGVLLIFGATLAISGIEGTHLSTPFFDLIFDVTSAFGTVGLSTGVTANLSTGSKLLIALVMFVGRLGPVTFVTALAERQRMLPYRLPTEAIRIG